MIKVPANLKGKLLYIEFTLVFPFFLDGFAIPHHSLVSPCKFLDAYRHLLSAAIVVSLQLSESLSNLFLIKWLKILKLLLQRLFYIIYLAFSNRRLMQHIWNQNIRFIQVKFLSHSSYLLILSQFATPWAQGLRNKRVMFWKQCLKLMIQLLC